jgi:hypothetical protein
MVDIETFRQWALSFPEATEQLHFNRPSFKIKKIFATLDLKNNRACLMLSEIDQSVFCAIDQSVIYPIPNKWGKQGATYVDLKKVRKDVLKDALKHAYHKCITKKPTSNNRPG